MGVPRGIPDSVELEIRLLLEVIYRVYHYDFRDYAMASLKRRLTVAATRMQCSSIRALQEKLLGDETVFTALLQYLTVPVSEMFRDASYFLALRQSIVPVLKTYPSVRIWVAGCSTGEEAYSLAIILKEEALLDRALLHATDINPESLRKAKAGIFDLDRMRQFSESHRLSGGQRSLSEYYHAAHGSAVFDKELRDKINFSDHSLATDHVFAEVQLVSCRNVLIYFDRALQERAIGLFSGALCRRGFLGLGSKESLRFSSHAGEFIDFDAASKIYRKAT